MRRSSPWNVKAEVVDLLTAMGLALKRRGEVPRARAYLGAANTIARLDDFEQLLEQDRLQDIRGVGASIERRIKAFVERGERPEWLEDVDVAQAQVADEELGEVPRVWDEAPFRDAPDLHCHTTWSDGTLSLEEVVAVAERLGLRAIGVSDHSGSLRIARGLSPSDVRKQWEHVARVQEAHPQTRILRGTECDIMRDGSLDHPDEILAGFDYVIGSLHSQLKLDEDAQTERVLRALENDHLTILGHPTTRVPGYRPRANLDLRRVFEKAAERGVAMEVNGNPGRIDLDVDLAKQALQAGCRLSLGSDGHSAREMLSLARAREIAAEAGAGEGDILNLDFLP